MNPSEKKENSRRVFFFLSLLNNLRKKIYQKNDVLKCVNVQYLQYNKTSTRTGVILTLSEKRIRNNDNVIGAPYTSLEDTPIKRQAFSGREKAAVLRCHFHLSHFVIFLTC